MNAERVQDIFLRIPIACLSVFYPLLNDFMDDDFTIRVAKEPKEIKQLLEVGFEYFCEKENLMFFRKRK